MEFVVIPYLLVLNSIGEINKTNYRPEYTYAVTMRFQKSNGTNFGSLTDTSNFVDPMTETMATLRCWPQDLPNVLGCSIGPKTVEKWDSVRYFTGIDRKPENFEIRFQENGIESLRVSSETSEDNQSFLKEIAARLNVGTSLTSKGPSNFTITRNSTTGGCKIKYDLSTNVGCYEDSTQLTLKDIAEFNITSTLADEFRDGFVLKRSKNVRQCDNTSYTLANDDLLALTVTSDVSEMVFCKNFFKSTSISTGKLVTVGSKPEPYFFRQFVEVRLENIEYVDSRFVFVVEPPTHEIYLHKPSVSNFVET